MKSPARTEPGKLVNDRMNRREATLLSKYAKQLQTAKWDFTADGGAAGDYGFAVKLPANSIVTAVLVDEQTAVAGATDVVLKAGSTDLTSSIDFTAQSGAIEYATLAGGASAIKVTSSSELKMTITGTAATAGKVRFAVEFYTSD